MAISTQTCTLTDLLALPEDGPRCELVGGDLIVMPPPDIIHMLIAGELFAWFHQAQRAGYGIAGNAPCAVGLDYPQLGLRGIDGPEPDVFFVRKAQSSIVQGGFVQGVPDIIIEVLSPTTREIDLPGGNKWKAYERNRVAHYWLVDPEPRAVVQYAYRSGHFVEVARLYPGDPLVCPLFPTIRRDVADLFANVPTEPDKKV
jgi:Uma2 family endonuclease